MARCRFNPEIQTEGKAIIVGTSQGLHAHVKRQEARVSVVTEALTITWLLSIAWFHFHRDGMA